MTNSYLRVVSARRIPKYVACAVFLVLCAAMLNAQIVPRDPGPRPGPAGAGGVYPGVTSLSQRIYAGGLAVFNEVDSVSATIESGIGLGPTFNGNSCAMCHAQPAVGGSSPAPFSPQVPIPNPQIALATLDRTPGGANSVPFFITANGPVREARFIRNPDGTPDGGVHGLFTIAGRKDAPGCNLAQPDFKAQAANRNLVFRIPTPIYGAGLIENTPDSELQANLAANASQKAALGIAGRLNTSGNDGTVTRFGWKAQNKSLLIFSAEAYNVEMGVSNEGFTNERAQAPGCVFNPTPEDTTNFYDSGVAPPGSTTTNQVSSDVENFTLFMRLLAPPTPTTHTQSELNGQTLFNSIGCALCHTPTLMTAASNYEPAMSNAMYHPFSDIAIHHMGSRLADGISQGAAGPDEFRTAPLWGVGQRLFFLHDGRTSNLMVAIQLHASEKEDCAQTQSVSQFVIEGGERDRNYSLTSSSQSCGSEANGVIHAFNRLSPSQQQDILNFLRSL